MQFYCLQDQVEYEWLAKNGTLPVTLDVNSSRLNQFKLINHTWSRDVIKTISGEILTKEYYSNAG